MEKRYRLTLRGAGPLTRSTLGRPESDPNERVLEDMLHWVWSSQLQIRRLIESTNAEWNSSSLDPALRRKVFSQTTFDEHIVLVAGRNLVRALDRAQEQFPALGLTDDMRACIKLLRDIYEHWDEQREAFLPGGPPKERSGKEFAERHPDGKPWSITYAASGLVLGGVLPLNDFLVSLDGLESALLRLEAETT